MGAFLILCIFEAPTPGVKKLREDVLVELL